MASNTRTPDFHHYVQLKDTGNWLKLDVTWHGGLAAFGFRVNEDWADKDDTLLTSVPEHKYPNEEDIIGFKVQ